MKDTVGTRPRTAEMAGTPTATKFHLRPEHFDIHHETYTVEEAAALLSIGGDVLRHAISSGDLIAERAGQAMICIKRPDLIRWLTEHGPGM